MRRTPRRAFSLMEVLLATGILLGSLIVLGQLATVGRMHARDAEKLTTAQLLCQTKLNEILAGVDRVRSVEEESLADGWLYSVEVTSADKLHLTSLRVTVWEDLPPEDDVTDGPLPKQFTLARWIRDPDREAPNRQPAGPEATTRPLSESVLTSPIDLGLEGGELP